MNTFLNMVSLSMSKSTNIHVKGIGKLSMTLTSIAGLVHVNDLDLTTQILISSCHICSVYAIKKFGLPNFFMAHTEQV